MIAVADKVTQAVILAGGLGTRLRPITNKVPKSLVPVNGRPFLEHQLLLMKRNGIKDFVLCVGYLWEQIKNYFGDGSKFGVKIEYAVEKEPMGTGGALKNAQNYLNEAFILLNGDTYVDIDYRTVAAFFLRTGKTALTVVYDNSDGFVNKSNIVVGSDNANTITRYEKQEGKSADDDSADSTLHYVDAGAHVFRKKILDYFPDKDVFSLEEEIFPKLINVKELIAFKTKQRFYDMGDEARLKRFEEYLKNLKKK